MAVKPWLGAIAEPTNRNLKFLIKVQIIHLILPLLMSTMHLNMYMGTDVKIQDRMSTLIVLDKPYI